jgi:hypothetical protein
MALRQSKKAIGNRNRQAEGVKAEGVKEQQSAHLLFQCQLSIVNCQLLKAIEMAKLKTLKTNRFMDHFL